MLSHLVLSTYSAVAKIHSTACLSTYNVFSVVRTGAFIFCVWFMCRQFKGNNVKKHDLVQWCFLDNMLCLTLYILLVFWVLPNTGHGTNRKLPSFWRNASSLLCIVPKLMHFFFLSLRSSFCVCLHHKSVKTFVCSKARQKQACCGGSGSDFSFSTARNISFLCEDITSVWNPLATHKGRALKAPFCYMMSLNPLSSTERRADARLAITIFCTSVL